MTEDGVLEGSLIAESLRPGTQLVIEGLSVTKIARAGVADTAPGQPPVWTGIWFRAPAGTAAVLTRQLEAALAQPGWYADFRIGEDITVVFPGRSFRYRRGDKAAEQEARTHAASLDIPHNQLDWGQ